MQPAYVDFIIALKLHLTTFEFKMDSYNPGEEENLVGWKVTTRKRQCVALMRGVPGGLSMEKE